MNKEVMKIILLKEYNLDSTYYHIMDNIDENNKVFGYSFSINPKDEIFFSVELYNSYLRDFNIDSIIHQPK